MNILGNNKNHLPSVLNGSMPTRRPVNRLRGFSLIELMVVVVIMMMMSLAIFGVISSSEGKKRTLTTVNDITQAGNYSMYQLEKLIRSAGSGFSQNYQTVYGCKLLAAASGTQILPFTTAQMAAPFTALNTALTGVYRLLPVVIAKNMTSPNLSGKTSDALIVMAGAAGYGEVPMTFIAPPQSAQLSLQNTVPFNPNDLPLVMNITSATGTNCMLQQVSSTFVGGAGITALPLAGNYAAATIAGQNLTGYSVSGYTMNMGNTGGNLPVMQIIGVGNNNTLFQYDLMQSGTFNTPFAMTDGVFEMHALYGIDSDGDGKLDTWQDPGTAPYDYLSLENGSAAAVSSIKSIKAIRIGLILRTSLIEKVTVPPATSGPITLFSDLGVALTYTRVLNATEQNYRYRTIELTIPLRNSIYLG